MSERTEAVACDDGIVRRWIGQWVPYVAAGRDKIERRARLAEVPGEAREKVRDEVISMGARRATAGRITTRADKEPMS
jgi:hypothetical protein